MTRERRYVLIGTILAVVFASPYVLRAHVSVGEKASLMLVGVMAVFTMAVVWSSK